MMTFSAAALNGKIMEIVLFFVNFLFGFSNFCAFKFQGIC
jgi:hypothetical protein